MQISQDDWGQWINNPVTQAVKRYIEDQIASAQEQMLNLDITSPRFTLETYGLNAMALRYQIEGLAEFADFANLKDRLVQEEGQKVSEVNYGV